MPRKKPEPPKSSPSEIRAVQALSTRMCLPTGQPSACNVCGLTSGLLGLWREHDEYDRPVQGDYALVYIGKDHPACMRIMEDHPRLYSHDEGHPGAWPLLCGPCRHRDGFKCKHPDLRANGGPGLRAIPSIGTGGVIVCVRRARGAPPLERDWVECKGRELVIPPAAPVDAP